ncbi:MAG: PAS domain S-box protein, partial [bacterium]|nr:PAS domain S-box protein [bacterium]
MTKKKNGIQKQRMHVASPKPVTALRQKAEEHAARVPEDLAALPPAQFQQIIHELRVHQIELELQNEELRAVQVARERYFDLYEQAPVGYITLSDKGLILEANLTATTLLDTFRSAMIKQPLTKFIFKEDQDIYYQHLKQFLATATPQVFELRMVKKAGTPCWVRMDATVAQDAGGAPLYRVTLSDISAIKKAEDELQKLLKLQSVGTLAGGIALDFNNILMSLFGNISLAKDGLAKEHPSRVLLEEAETSMNRAVRLTKQLLTFAKGGDPVKECVS